MLTPIFRLEQDETTLSVFIHAPMAKLNELEICVEEQVFFFTAPPYYLKFELPGPVHSDEESFKVKFSDGEFHIILYKKEFYFFKDLDLIVKLMNRADPASCKPSVLVEEIGCGDSGVLEDPELFENLDWFSGSVYDFGCDANDHPSISDEIVILSPTYGFCGSKSGLFKVESDLTHVVELPNPDGIKAEYRSKLRIAAEAQKFCPVHYLADLYEPECWKSALVLRVPWYESNTQKERSELTNEQRHRLIALSTRRLPPLPTDSSEIVSLYLGFLDLLLAYTYDYRVREGEEMTESGWNIAKLASTLTWFEVFHSLSDVLITFRRRALAYPLVRNWKFCTRVQSDVARLLQRNDVQSWCVKCLLEIRTMLIQYPGHHVFSDLFLDDYIVWIQTRASVRILHDLGFHVQHFKIKKSDIGLNLDEIEKVGAKCLAEEQLNQAVENLTITPTITETH